MSNLGDLGGGSAVAHDVNEPGQIVGASSNGTVTHPFVWWQDQMHDLGTVAGGTATPGRAWSVNNRGDIVGFSRVAGTTSQATLWAGPNRPRLGQPVGLGSLGDGERFSEAFAINNLRQVVGRSLVTGSTERAFLWEQDAGMTDLGALGLNQPRDRHQPAWTGGRIRLNLRRLPDVLRRSRLPVGERDDVRPQRPRRCGHRMGPARRRGHQ